MRLNVIGNSPPAVKRKDFVSKGIETGVCLHGDNSKRDSMWHSPVFTCIRANRIPVIVYKKLYEFLSHMNANSVFKLFSL